MKQSYDIPIMTKYLVVYRLREKYYQDTIWALNEKMVVEAQSNFAELFEVQNYKAWFESNNNLKKAI